jgi:hypothetical protein
MHRSDDGNCSCPHFAELKDGRCVCKPGFINVTTEDDCKCPGNETTVDSTCICLEGFVRDGDNNCVCPKYEDFIDNACHCKAGKLLCDSIFFVQDHHILSSFQDSLETHRRISASVLHSKSHPGKINANVSQDSNEILAPTNASVQSSRSC